MKIQVHIQNLKYIFKEFSVSSIEMFVSESFITYKNKGT